MGGLMAPVIAADPRPWGLLGPIGAPQIICIPLATAIPTRRSAQPRGIAYVEAIGVPGPYRAACGQALAIANRELGGVVDGVSLRYFARQLGDGGRWVFNSAAPVGGLTDIPHARIWIAAFMPLPEAIHAVAHECRHYWQLGRGMSAAAKERDADLYAHGFWQKHSQRFLLLHGRE